MVMATLKCDCGFQGKVPDSDIGKSFFCTKCGRKLVASVDESKRIVQHSSSHNSKCQPTSYEQKEQENEIRIRLDGGVGPVGLGYQEIKEARKKIFKGAILSIFFGVISLISSTLSIGLAVFIALPAVYGVGLLIWGSYEEYIHEHGIPKK
jgi:hypothetical protein